MKYLGILKDSLREALDTKVFYFMLALSSLLILVVASLSFRPVSVEEEARVLTGTVNWGSSFMPPGQRVTWEIRDFTQTNEDAPPWERNYGFTLVVQLSADRSQGGANHPYGDARFIRDAFRQSFFFLDNVKVEEQKDSTPRELRYRFSSQGAKVSTIREWPHEATVLFLVPLKIFHSPLAGQVFFIEDFLVNTAGAAVALLMSTVITAFFIPNMLRKGTVDLLLAKPIHRTSLLIWKYIGGLLFMFLNVVFVVVGIWLVLGWRSNLWGTGFLWTIPILTFQFALFYAVSTLFGVWTRSPIVAILMASAFWLLLFVAGLGYRWIDTSRRGLKDVQGMEAFAEEAEKQGKSTAPEQTKLPDWAYRTADAVHFVLPRVKDMDSLTSRLITADLLPPDNPLRKQAEKQYTSFSWTESIAVTAVYIVVLLGLACWRFAVEDY